MGQTDIFAHFIHIKRQKDGEEFEAPKQLSLNSKEKSYKKKRMTEKEEDEALLKDGDHSESATTITASPECLIKKEYLLIIIRC